MGYGRVVCGVIGYEVRKIYVNHVVQSFVGRSFGLGFYSSIKKNYGRRYHNLT